MHPITIGGDGGYYAKVSFLTVLFTHGDTLFSSPGSAIRRGTSEGKLTGHRQQDRKIYWHAYLPRNAPHRQTNFLTASPRPYLV
jgi:hypothetical protein